MAKKNGPSVKEIYRLWFEYLKRDKDDKEFCEWMEKRKKTRLPIPEKFLKDKNGFVHPAVWGFLHFHNIHSCSFEEWWVVKKHVLERRKKLSESAEEYSESVENRLEPVRFDIVNSIDEFKSQKQKVGVRKNEV